MACEDADSANEALIAALTSPAKVAGDAGSVEQRSISELIAANNYLRSTCAGNGPRQGLRFTRLVPDGTVQRS